MRNFLLIISLNNYQQRVSAFKNHKVGDIYMLQYYEWTRLNRIIDIDIFVNCNLVDPRWQQYSTHLHPNNTQNDTKQTIHRTTQQLGGVAGRALSWLVIPWHLPYN